MIQVTTTFIGASATDVEASVATPLEQQINGVENMIYMKSTNANDGTLTLKVSFEVGSNLDMDNVLTQNRVSQAHAADAAVGQELRRLGEEGAGVSAARHLDQVAERHLRQQLSLELHDHQHQRRHRPHPGRRADQPVRRQRLRDARLAAAGRHRPARPHGPRHRQRHHPAEPVDAGRSDRRAAGGRRHRVHLHRPHAGAPAQRGGVRRTSSCAPTRTAPRSASRTSRGSSSGRCSTTPSAATTASRRPSSPCSRFPAPTRSTSPTRSRRRWPI